MNNTLISNIKKRKNRSNKINLVFDEAKRREFLTGFHKRKLQRKKKAKEKLEIQLKQERKRLKTEAKESYKKLIGNNYLVPELEQLFQEYGDDQVTVKITELSPDDIAKQTNLIGPNSQKYIVEDKNTSGILTEMPFMDIKTKGGSKSQFQRQQLNSKKDIKKALKKCATKNMQNSNIFKKKNKLESQKQKKKSLQQKREKVKHMKIKKKNNKRKH